MSQSWILRVLDGPFAGLEYSVTELLSTYSIRRGSQRSLYRESQRDEGRRIVDLVQDGA